MARLRILVVEDENIIAMDLERRIGTLGYEVSGIACSAEEAIEKAKALRPDLILMDIVLQGRSDGIDAAQQIRSFSRVPIIYLTAYASDDARSRAEATQPFVFLIKPFEELELRSALEAASADRGQS